MARINIEDSFWIEVVGLMVRVGDQDKAIGNVIRFWHFAQERHKNGKPITEEDFKTMGFLEDLFPIFAERTEMGIIAKGGDKHFAWLSKKREDGRKGGRVSAHRPRDSKGRLLANISHNNEDQSSKQTPSKLQANSKQALSDTQAAPKHPQISEDLPPNDPNLPIFCHDTENQCTENIQANSKQTPSKPKLSQPSYSPSPSLRNNSNKEPTNSSQTTEQPVSYKMSSTLLFDTKNRYPEETKLVEKALLQLYGATSLSPQRKKLALEIFIKSGNSAESVIDTLEEVMANPKANLQENARARGWIDIALRNSFNLGDTEL